MNKFSLALGAIIAITAIIAIATTNYNVVKAYSCNSSSSNAHTPSSSTGVSGAKGGCSTSSSSSSAQRLVVEQLTDRMLQLKQQGITQVSSAHQARVALSQVAPVAQQVSRLPS